MWSTNAYVAYLHVLNSIQSVLYTVCIKIVATTGLIFIHRGILGKNTRTLFRFGRKEKSCSKREFILLDEKTPQKACLAVLNCPIALESSWAVSLASPAQALLHVS